MATLATFFQLAFQATVSDDDYPFGPDPLDVQFPFTEASLADGTGTGEANVVGVKVVTVAASGSTTVDLATGLEDPRDHSAVSLSSIKAFAIYNPHDPDAEPWANCIVGGAAGPAWESWTTDAGATVDIHPGGVWPLYSPAGYTVNSAHKDLLFTNPNTTGSMTLHLMVVGN